MNFTYTVDKDMNGDWGAYPKSGPYNASGEWTGVMGDVVRGRYDMSLSAWTWWIERHRVVTLVIVLSSRTVLLWTPKKPRLDVALFVRPFTEDSWSVILIVISVAVLCRYLARFVVDCELCNIATIVLFPFYV